MFFWDIKAPPSLDNVLSVSDSPPPKFEVTCHINRRWTAELSVWEIDNTCVGKLSACSLYIH